MARQFSIIIALEFGGDLQPLVKFFLVFLPLLLYTLAVFAVRPFVSSEQDFVECSTQGLLIFAGFGGLLKTEGRDDSITADLGNAVVYGTLILAALLIIWALVRDLAYFFGSKQALPNVALSSVVFLISDIRFELCLKNTDKEKRFVHVYQVLQNLSKGEIKLPVLGPFDKGLNSIMLFHFAEHASAQELRTYMNLRTAVLSSKTLLGKKEFWEGETSTPDYASS